MSGLAAGIAAGIAGGDVYIDRGAVVSHAFTPTDISGCVLWLKADTGVTKDGSNLVSLWADQSGSGNDAPCAATGLEATPLYQATGGPSSKPDIKFRSANLESLHVADNVGLRMTSITVFFVGRYNASNVNQAIITKTSSGSWANGWLLGDTVSGDGGNVAFWVGKYTNSSTSFRPTIGSFFRCAARCDGTHTSMWHGDTKLADTSVVDALTVSTHNITIGHYPGAPAIGNYFDGEDSEIIVYNSALSDADVGRVNAYLSAKWGLLCLLSAHSTGQKPFKSTTCTKCRSVSSPPRQCRWLSVCRRR